MLTISYKYHFDACHHLPNYSGRCANVHGHRWELEVFITSNNGVDQKSGMLMDFKKLKNIVQVIIDDKFDHRDLNLTIENPTAEYLVVYISTLLKRQLEGVIGINLVKIKLWETPDCCVIWEEK